MDKQTAIEILGGGSASKVADAIGISPSAVSQWPDVLPSRIVDRVQAALWRRHQAAQSAQQSDAVSLGAVKSTELANQGAEVPQGDPGPQDTAPTESARTA